MNRIEPAAFGRAMRSVVPFEADIWQGQMLKVVTAVVPAVGIIGACAVMMAGIVA